MPFMRGLHTEDEDRAFVRDRVFAEAEVWVAELDRSLIGMCDFRAGWLDHLYIHPDRHGLGVGTALLQRAKDANRALQLWVFQSNREAIAFYERRGFTRVRETDGSGNEERQPDALYRWAATPRE